MSNLDKDQAKESIPRWMKRYGVWIFVVICIVLFRYSDFFFKSDVKGSANPHGEALKVTLTIVAGTAVFYGLWITHRRVKALDEQVRALNNQNSIAEKGNADERFKNAIEHLGSGKSSIVLGGVHSLHRIASEYSYYNATVFDILCSYLRDATKDKADGESINTVEQTILDLLFKYPFDEKSIYDGLVADLKGVRLPGANLFRANLYYADLTESDLSESDLTETDLGWANLTRADLSGAYLTRSDLTRSDLTGANLTKTNLTGANLTWANLTWVNLTGADLYGVIGLDEAVLNGATLPKVSRLRNSRSSGPAGRL